MGCSCKDRGKKRFTVELPGGTKITKSSEDEAIRFAAKHPGAKVVKPAA